MARGAAPALILAVMLAACGGGGSSATKSSPSPSISAAATPTASSVKSSPVVGLCADQLLDSTPRLMAVLEAKGSATTGTGVPFSDAHDTVAIAGLDAVAHARSTFATRTHPYIGNAAPVLAPHEAYVVHGTVYFIDGFGTVFTLGADGTQKIVAKFPIGLDQQEVSFAVSPDGCQLVATALTIPPKGPATPGSLPPLNGTWKLVTMAAGVGGPTQVLHTWTSASSPDSTSATFKNLVLAGWDSVGPVVVVGSALGLVNIPFLVLNPDFIGTSIAHLRADGTPGPPIATPNCVPIQLSPAGYVTCYSDTGGGQSATVSVLSPTGAVDVARFNLTAQTELAVGPNHLVALTGQWRGPNGVIGMLPANFHPEGWLNANTIFGRLSDTNGIGDAAFAHLSGSQATIEDLTFKGDFVGGLT